VTPPPRTRPGPAGSATEWTAHMDSFVIWTAAWGIIVIIDFFVLNRGRADVPAL